LKLVADRFEAGRGPVADLLARASSQHQISARCRSATSFEPDSVMEFGLYQIAYRTDAYGATSVCGRNKTPRASERERVIVLILHQL